MDKIQEAYINTIVEGTEQQIVSAIKKLFNIKVRKIETKCKTTLKLADYLDQENMANWDKIDKLQEFIKSRYKDSIVTIHGTTIEIEEL